MSVRTSALISATPTARIYVKICTGDFYEKIGRKNPNAVKIWQDIRHFALRPNNVYIAVGTITSP